MPEGDTIHKVALYLRPRLVDEHLLEPDRRLAPGVATLMGDCVDTVEAIGKHLIVTTDARRLQVHLGMRGTWHHYRIGERWKFGEHQARVVLTVRCGVLVCFRAPQVRVTRRADPASRATVERLGPDLLGDAPDIDSIAERARRFAAESPVITDTLLDQRVSCGIGNAFKSEILFLEGVAPNRATESLSDGELHRLFSRARELMLPNLAGGPRTTTIDISKRRRPDHLPRYWVYGRRNEPCLKCGTRIERTIDGRHSRVTYWCPRCQPGGQEGLRGDGR